MALNSINTNVGAMVALSNLNSVNSDLAKVQDRVSTGLKVSSAKDDASIFAVAQGVRANIRSFEAVNQALSSAKGVLSVSISAATEVSNLMQDVKAKLVQLSDDTLTQAQREVYTDDLRQMTDQMYTFIDRADYNGINILGAKDQNGTPTPNDPTDDTAPADINVVQAVDGDSLTIRANNLTGTTAADDGWLGFARIVYTTADDTDATSDMTITAGAPVPRATITATAARAALGNNDGTAANAVYDDAWNKFNDQINQTLGNLGADNRNVQFQLSFNESLLDSTTEGLGNLVDADLAKESAKLQALQTKQQLATQTLSIANQAPQSILSLFQG